MRLNRFDPNNIRVGTAGGGRNFPGGGGGKVGCGTILIAIVAAVLFGVDPMQTIGALGGGQAPTEQQAQFISTVTDMGGIAFVATSTDDVEAKINEYFNRNNTHEGSDK